MPVRRERGGLERALRMAADTAILVGSAGELSAVGIPVACDAGRILNSIDHSIGARQMTLVARHVDVVFSQGKLRCGMLSDPEIGRLETCDRVARSAVAAIRARGKLAAMRVLLVAIGAVIERHRLLEIRAFVTGIAGHSCVLPQQRESRLGVIEVAGDPARLPIDIGSVAGLACAREDSLVRIAVARRAVLECDTSELCIRLCILYSGMTLPTADLLMGADKSVARPAVIEFGKVLPVRHVMTPGTVISQLSVVFIVMASQALPGQAEIGVGKVPGGDAGPGRCRDEIRLVA